MGVQILTYRRWRIKSTKLFHKWLPHRGYITTFSILIINNIGDFWFIRTISTSQILSKIGRAQRIFVYKFSSYQLKVIQPCALSIFDNIWDALSCTSCTSHSSYFRFIWELEVKINIDQNNLSGSKN